MRETENPEPTLTIRTARRASLLGGIGRRLVLTDGLAVSLAVLVALRFDSELGPGQQLLVACVSIVGWLITLAVGRTRHERLLGFGAGEYHRVIASAAAAVGLTAVLLSVLPVHLPVNTALHALLPLLFVLAGRVCWRLWLARRRDHGDHLSHVVVAGPHADSVAQRIASSPAAGLNVIDVRDGSISPDEIMGAALSRRTDGVVIAGDGGLAPAQISDLRWELESRGMSLLIDTTLIDTDPQRLELWSGADFSLVRVAPRDSRPARRWAKSAIDRVGALLGLLMLTPLLAVVAAVVKAEDGGPVLFRQKRVGKDGAEFDIVKFRTMSVDAEQRIAELQAANEADGPLFKMREDPRITRAGRVLRKYSIDELPQLWNVLVGEMSLVGPRPALPAEVAEYEDRTRRRLAARPGITGLWQVSGRSDLSWEQGVGLDISYIDNWSLAHDSTILARTVGAVIRPRGAY